MHVGQMLIVRHQSILIGFVFVCFHAIMEQDNPIDMDVQALPECILPGQKNVFGLGFHVCNAVLSLYTFSNTKTAECI